MQEKIKILFILPSLVAGGAERVVSFIAQNIDKEKYDATLLITGYERDTVYDVSSVNVIYLNKNRVLFSVIPLFINILKIKPKVVMSSIGHLNTIIGLLSFFFPKTKFITREASVISSIEKFNNKSNKIYSWLAFLGIKKIDKVVCQSQDMAYDFIKLFKISEEKTIVINNPITQDFTIKEKIENPESLVNFITIGRLSREKGHQRILTILSQLKIDFHYTIIGDGPLKKEIFEDIDKLNLRDKITHIPYTNEVLKYLKENDLFLQGSYVEGFPNAVLESCMVGTPVLAFNVPGGTKEIIVNNVNGYLVDSEEDYLHHLNKPIGLNPKSVSKSVKEKFDKEIILSKYEDLFQSILKKTN
ncbi:glycosyltransferase [Flavobacteriaceae bacterium R38]|nr:glycosyltransferase [Flavobacteriaceae bacterium R38]